MRYKCVKNILYMMFLKIYFKMRIYYPYSLLIYFINKSSYINIDLSIIYFSHLLQLMYKFSTINLFYYLLFFLILTFLLFLFITIIIVSLLFSYFTFILFIIIIVVLSFLFSYYLFFLLLLFYHYYSLILFFCSYYCLLYCRILSILIPVIPVLS